MMRFGIERVLKFSAWACLCARSSMYHRTHYPEPEVAQVITKRMPNFSFWHLWDFGSRRELPPTMKLVLHQCQFSISSRALYT